MQTIITKTFSELSTLELYDILQLRSEVFVVEQNCVYQDIDDKDQKAFHVIGIKNDKVIAYARIFKPGDYFTEASIGRVAVAKNERSSRYGYRIMEDSIKTIKNLFNQTTIKISAQLYLKSFYSSLGFQQVGDAYLEDGIPHIAMIKNNLK